MTEAQKRAYMPPAPQGAGMSDAEEMVKRLREQHMDTCDTALLPGQGYACSCGHESAAALIEQQAREIAGGRLDLKVERARAVRAEAELAKVRAVLDEVERATQKFPTWPTDPLHAVAVLGEEFGELTKATLQSVYEPHKSSPQDVRAEAIQTAAMAVRFLASLDRYVYARGEQHSQIDAARAAGGEHE